MKTFGKIIICIVVILVILVAIGTAYLIHNYKTEETNNSSLLNTNTSNDNQNTDNNLTKNDTITENDENTDYIGEEEKQEEVIENDEPQENQEQEEQSAELTGKEKAIDIVEKKYAIEGQTVKFDHMEGENYVIKINTGTAVTWYLVNGTTWEAEEY